MTPTEAIEIYKAEKEKFNETREIQWKFNIAMWGLITAAIYFFVVVPVNALVSRMNRGDKPPDPTTKKCPECLSEIPRAARRCAFCTAQLALA